MAIYMTAHWQCHPASQKKVIKALREFVSAVQQSEPGVYVYTALQGKQDKNRFLTYFVFEDEDAREFHRTTEWVRRFTEIIYPESIEPVVFNEYQVVASTRDFHN